MKIMDKNRIIACISVIGIILGLIFSVILLGLFLGGLDRLEELQEIEEELEDKQGEEPFDLRSLIIEQEIEDQRNDNANIFAMLFGAMVLTSISFHASIICFKKLKKDDNKGGSLQTSEQIKWEIEKY
jgi:uncharacterized membrane protein (DUF106 family)